MTIEKHIDGDQNITLALSGDIDTTTFLQLREAVTAVPDDIGRLTLDFRDVRVITSAGLRELLVCAQRFGEERLLVKNVSPEVMKIFEMTGFDSILTIEEAREDNATYVHMTLQTLLRRRVEKSGDKVALRNETEAYTWRDIDVASPRSSRAISPRWASVGDRTWASAARIPSTGYASSTPRRSWARPPC